MITMTQVYAGNQSFALMDGAEIFALGAVTNDGAVAVWLDPSTIVPRFGRYSSLAEAERQLQAELAAYGQFVVTTKPWHGETALEYEMDELTLNKPQLRQDPS